MNRRWGFVFTLLVLLASCSVSAWSLVVEHPSQQPELLPDSYFPRCTSSELQLGGFPDHKHAWWWGDWEVLKDADGNSYGPRAYCKTKVLTAPENMDLEAGLIRYQQFELHFNPGYESCDMMLFLELLDYAGHLVPELLGLSTESNLIVTSPDDNKQYYELTGQGVWRLYKLEGNSAYVEPIPILQARTLEGHAAFMLVTEWLLEQTCGDKLPVWLKKGLTEYIGEDGVHLVNYMTEFRGQGSVVYSAPMVDLILGSDANPDRGVDREHFRRASYSAYLMVWQLVENEGGLEVLREFLQLVNQGTNPDEASLQAYGVSLADLSAMLDPAQLGEPLGKHTQSRRPNNQP